MSLCIRGLTRALSLISILSVSRDCRTTKNCYIRDFRDRIDIGIMWHITRKINVHAVLGFWVYATHSGIKHISLIIIINNYYDYPPLPKKCWGNKCSRFKQAIKIYIIDRYCDYSPQWFSLQIGQYSFNIILTRTNLLNYIS